MLFRSRVPAQTIFPPPDVDSHTQIDADTKRHAWERLVAGASCIADMYQEAGRSHVVLAPATKSVIRRALTDREQCVIRRMAHGLTDKEIGAELGISISSVATHRGRAQRKLGLGSRVVLMQLVHLLDGMLDAEPAPCPGVPALPSERMTVTLPDWLEQLPQSLTIAERHVAAMLLDGLSNDAIARARGTSPRTVANQLAAISRKIGVGGRRALVAALLRLCLAGFVSTTTNRPPAMLVSAA